MNNKNKNKKFTKRVHTNDEKYAKKLAAKTGGKISKCIGGKFDGKFRVSIVTTHKKHKQHLKKIHEKSWQPPESFYTGEIDPDTLGDFDYM